MKKYSIKSKIRFSDCDPAGICYFSRYATFFDESFVDYMQNEGLDWDAHLPENLNYLIPVVESNVKYHASAVSQNQIEVITVTLVLNEKFAKTGHAMIRRSGDNVKLLADGSISRVCVDYSSFKAKAFPDKLRNTYEKIKTSELEWEEYLISLGKKIRN